MRRFPCHILSLLIILFLHNPVVVAQEKCVDAEGEAAILNNDAPSAKMEAMARAKWAAIEQVVGSEVKAQSFVQNFVLIEEVIKKQVGGVVRNYRILKQENREDTVFIRINACVEPKKAQQAVSSLALNNAVAVFIPARNPNSSKGTNEYDETNILSETLIGKLTDQNYTVVDIAPTHVMDAREIETAVKTGSTLAVRSMMYKFLSNVIIIGKIDYAVSTKKGENIGYGIGMPFNNVTVRLTYRIVAKNSKTGNMEILSAGAEEAKGLAGSVEDAAAAGLKNLAEIVSPVILDKVAHYIKGSVKRISIKIAGVTDMDANMEIKEALQNIVWVSDVDEKRMGEFVVGYPENSLYLANSLKQKGIFTIVDYSPYAIALDYKKQSK